MAGAEVPRAVLDTNVVVSSLVFGARLGWLRTSWQAGLVRPLASASTLKELIRVLHYPKLAAVTGPEPLLAAYVPFCEVVEVPNDVVVPRCRDPYDKPFLQLAVRGRADLLITGDEDLLALAPQFAFRIARPEDCRRLIGVVSERLASYRERRGASPAAKGLGRLGRPVSK